MTLKQKIKKTEVDDNVTTVETLSSRDWSRDNIDQRFREVRSAYDDIENRLQKKVEKFENIPDPNDFLDSWESWLDQRNTSTDLQMIGNKDAVPGAAVLAWNESITLLIDYLVLQSELEELERFALKKFNVKFEELLEEYRLAKSYDTIQDALGDQAEKFAVEKAEEYFRKMEAMVNEFEKFEQARLEERKADRKAFRRVAEQATGVDEDEVEKLAESARESIEGFLDDNGVLTLDPDELDALRDRSERDNAADSVASDFAGEDEDDGEKKEVQDEETSKNSGDDSEKSLREELVENWSEYKTMKQTDLAKMFDVNPSRISQIKTQEDLD